VEYNLAAPVERGICQAWQTSELLPPQWPTSTVLAVSKYGRGWATIILKDERGNHSEVCLLVT